MTAQGKNLKFWDQPVPVEIEPAQPSLLEQPAPPPMVDNQISGTSADVPLSDEQAEQVAEDTLQHLADVGFCLWECRYLNDSVIMIVDKEMPPEAPSGYPVYSREELEKMDPLPISTVRLINHVKKTMIT